MPVRRSANPHRSQRGHLSGPTPALAGHLPRRSAEPLLGEEMVGPGGRGPTFLPSASEASVGGSTAKPGGGPASAGKRTRERRPAREKVAVVADSPSRNGLTARAYSVVSRRRVGEWNVWAGVLSEPVRVRGCRPQVRDRVLILVARGRIELPTPGFSDLCSSY